MLIPFLITLHLLSSLDPKLLVLIEMIPTISILKIIYKNSPYCQEKKYGGSLFLQNHFFRVEKRLSRNLFLLRIVFLVVFFALGCFIPQDIFSPSLPLFYILIYLSLLI